MNLSLELFFDTTLDILCIAGYDGYFKKINPAFIRLLEYSEEELLSKKISEFIYVEDRDLTSGYREELKNNVPLLNFENRYVSKSGKLIWLHWTSIPSPNENIVYAVAKNITHKKELDKERATHFYRLDKKNKDLKNLNYKTSHDLRSPVNNILTLFNLLDYSTITNDETLKILDFIKLSTQGLKKSLDEYTDALKLTDTQEKNLVDVEFESVLKDVKTSISAIIEDSNAEFTYDFIDMESVPFNKAYMESIFLNFITNSIKYARPEYKA